MASRPLLFHDVHGENVNISDDRRRASRGQSFCNAVAFSNRPIAIDETVSLRLSDQRGEWNGVVRVGVTTTDPGSLVGAVPRYVCPDMLNTGKAWAKAIPERLCVQNYVVSFYVRDDGRVYLIVNGQLQGPFLAGVDTKKPLWVLLDIYGNTVSIDFLEDHAVPSFRRQQSQPTVAISSASSASTPIQMASAEVSAPAPLTNRRTTAPATMIPSTVVQQPQPIRASGGAIPKGLPLTPPLPPRPADLSTRRMPTPIPLVPDVISRPMQPIVRHQQQGISSSPIQSPLTPQSPSISSPMATSPAGWQPSIPRPAEGLFPRPNVSIQGQFPAAAFAQSPLRPSTNPFTAPVSRNPFRSPAVPDHPPTSYVAAGPSSIVQPDCNRRLVVQLPPVGDTASSTSNVPQAPATSGRLVIGLRDSASTMVQQQQRPNRPQTAPSSSIVNATAGASTAAQSMSTYAIQSVSEQRQRELQDRVNRERANRDQLLMNQAMRGLEVTPPNQTVASSSGISTAASIASSSTRSSTPSSLGELTWINEGDGRATASASASAIAALPQQQQVIRGKGECAICMEETHLCAFYPCGHANACFECGQEIMRRRDGCPLCRRPVNDILRLFF